MKYKSQTSHILQSFISFTKNQFMLQLRKLGQTMEKNLNQRKKIHSHGIEYQRTCIFTPQQIGVVEHKHRHILNVARDLHFQAHLPITFWGECVLTVVYIIK